VTLAVACLALLVALVAAVVAVLALRQSGRAEAGLRKHRLAHSRRDGQADPGAWDGGERRRLNLGPPRTGERRRPERPPAVPGQLAVEDAPTGPQEAATPPLGAPTAQIRAQLPRPGQHGATR